MPSNDYQKSQRKLKIACYLAGGLLLAAILAAYLLPAAYQYPDASRQSVRAQREFGTIRQIPCDDPLTVGLTVSQTIYPATGGSARPNAVVLVPDDDWRTAAAAARLSALPVDAPVIPIPSAPLPELVLREIRRLNPLGILRDAGAQVLLCGDLPSGVQRTLQDEGFRFRWLKASSPEELAEKIDHYLSILLGDHRSETVIVPVDDPQLAATGAFWAARRGQPILFSHQDSLPEATKRALDLRPRGAFIYVMAPAGAIGPDAIRDLANFGHVQRIPGEDAAELAASFAMYSDSGDQLRWWLDAIPRDMGWAASGPGLSPVFADEESPLQAMVSAALAHRGNAGPLLWLRQGNLPEPTQRLLRQLQPQATSHLVSRFNRGWVIGGPDQVPEQLTNQLVRLLRKREDENE